MAQILERFSSREKEYDIRGDELEKRSGYAKERVLKEELIKAKKDIREVKEKKEEVEVRKNYAHEAEKVIMQIQKEARAESQQNQERAAAPREEHSTQRTISCRGEVEMIPKDLVKPRTDLKNLNRDLEVQSAGLAAKARWEEEEEEKKRREREEEDEESE